MQCSWLCAQLAWHALVNALNYHSACVAYNGMLFVLFGVPVDVVGVVGVVGVHVVRVRVVVVVVVRVVHVVRVIVGRSYLDVQTGLKHNKNSTFGSLETRSS